MSHQRASINYPRIQRIITRQPAMLTLYIQALNQQQSIQDFRCVLPQFETALKTVNLIAAAGNVVLTVHVQEDGCRTHLPPQAFDGQDMCAPIQALQVEWEMLLAQPVAPFQPLNGPQLVTMTLDSINAFEGQMADYDASFTKLKGLLLQTGELLAKGPTKQQLLARYDTLTYRHQQAIEKVVKQRDRCLERLVKLKQMYTQ